MLNERTELRGNQQNAKKGKIIRLTIKVNYRDQDQYPWLTLKLLRYS